MTTFIQRGEVAKIVGVASITVTDWLQGRIIGCDAPQRGPGFANRFDFRDVVVAAAVKLARDAGMPLDVARQFRPAVGKFWDGQDIEAAGVLTLWWGTMAGATWSPDGADTWPELDGNEPRDLFVARVDLRQVGRSVWAVWPKGGQNGHEG